PLDRPLQAEEWNSLREGFQSSRTFEEVMLDRMVRHNSPIEVAKSLLTYVAKSNGEITYPLLIKYLKLCVRQGQTSEIRDLYDIMKSRFKKLEITAYTLFIRGLSDSDQWRMALTLLEELKTVTVPVRSNYQHCIRAAGRHQEVNLAFELYREMLTKDLVPSLDVLQVLFDISRGMKDAELQKELFGILLYFRENQIHPHKTFMESIKLWFESIPGGKWTGHLTNIKDSGHCAVCNHQLEDSNLTEEEYNNLSERIIKDVIHGSDIFIKTNPKECEAFQTFVESRLPFDIVIDGLNVSYMRRGKMQCENLFEVVNCLAKKNTRLLVLGRKHMLRESSNWRREMMSEMQNKAEFFFADRLSQDDPFLLYAALRSGSHCKVVTSDFLRDHKACLTDHATRQLFRKWQRGHQIMPVVSTRGHIKLLPALSCDCVVQTSGDTWHIPYTDTAEVTDSYHVPRKWLCVRQK
ncbi:MRPP3 ribonuclease, partial [Rhinopomastus cyanomelas]|nr:MRPP3 ribonuclease [Rhinopomastus cyanomelas]